MKKISLAVVGSMFLPLMAFAASSGGGLSGGTLSNALANIQSFINTLIPFIIGIAVVVFIFGLFKYITAGGDADKRKEALSTIITGIIVIAVMISVWGLINFVVQAFGLNQQRQVDVPQITMNI